MSLKILFSRSIQFGIIITCILLSQSLQSNGQDSLYLRKNAIPINNLAMLDRKVYETVNSYQVIMVGELHGTNEPANLVLALAELFLKYSKDSIQIGLEIPSEQMEEYLSKRSKKSIYASKFFSGESVDGRATVAWANIISSLYKRKNVDFFFYDNNKSDIGERDSIMFVNVKRRLTGRAHYKTILLSGNVHNMLTPFRNKQKVGCYLSHDKDLNLSKKILSVNHEYVEGSMLNNQGDGLKIHHYKYSKSIYARAVDYNSYFVVLPSDLNQKYNAIFFTQKVSAAQLTNHH